MTKLKICFVSSEIYPFAKTGGLADVSGALGKYLSNLGHDIRLVMPFYSSIDTKNYDLHKAEFARNCEISFGRHNYIYDIYTVEIPGSKAVLYLIHCPELYHRDSIYTDDNDEHIRFATLSRAAIELCQRMNWAPHVFHCNDWQSSLLPLYLKTIYKFDNLFISSKTLLTIHNIAYQGKFKSEKINDLSPADFHSFFDSTNLFHGKINFLQTGISYADFVSTVSETYAKEIQTSYFGEGLHKLLRSRSDDLVGILNGVDYSEWNPETDRLIPFQYTASKTSGKLKNKKHLLDSVGLKYKPGIPLLGMVTRLAEQKGVELLKGSIEKLLDLYDIRLVILGSGQPEYEHYLYFLQLQNEDKVIFHKGYDDILAHQIEAGADIFLMPSRYEPCGLNQIYSLKYGTIPVVRKTGGLADTVELYDWKTGKGTGFVFDHFTSDSLYWAMEYAITTYHNKPSWKKIIKAAMKQDFSWEKQVMEYISLYKNML